MLYMRIIFARTEQITCNFSNEWLSKLVNKRHYQEVEKIKANTKEKCEKDFLLKC